MHPAAVCPAVAAAAVVVTLDAVVAAAVDMLAVCQCARTAGVRRAEALPAAASMLPPRAPLLPHRPHPLTLTHISGTIVQSNQHRAM